MFYKIIYTGCGIINENLFFEGIPKELLPILLKNGKENFQQKVYRVAKFGMINEETFFNTFVEHKTENRLEQLKRKYGLDNIGTYSTSCYSTKESPDKYLKLLKERLRKKYPCPIIIEGKTVCGLSQLTIERDSNYLDNTHIDWWIYNKKCSIDMIIQVFKESKEGE